MVGKVYDTTQDEGQLGFSGCQLLQSRFRSTRYTGDKTRLRNFLDEKHVNQMSVFEQNAPEVISSCNVICALVGRRDRRKSLSKSKKAREATKALSAILTELFSATLKFPRRDQCIIEHRERFPSLARSSYFYKLPPVASRLSI